MRVQLAQTFIGLVFIVNSFVIEWLPGIDTNVLGFSAVTGALILGFPIARRLGGARFVQHRPLPGSGDCVVFHADGSNN
jgi:hypothetical protein